MKGAELRARTRKFALDVVDLCLQLGNGDLARLVRPQLMRAATGVASNNRAACRSRSGKEFVSRVSVVLEEADECELWLDILEVRQHGPSVMVSRLREESQELVRIFSASRRTTLETLERERARKRNSENPGK